jgi:saccharopine dehydrogenase-like NADP-dependent oxidoreductase
MLYMKNILVLGAGMVSKPLVVHLLKSGFQVKVASRTVSKAEALIQGYSHCSAEALNVDDEKNLDRLLSACDLAISLVPYTHHVQIANLCLKHKKHLVTTSYVSRAMQDLDQAAKSAGLCFLNEIGLDPGIDHMSAMRIIHHVQQQGGKIVSFQSYCGGLPAMRNNNNPFGYKFSWSPRGVVMAGRNSGQYLQNGKVLFIPSKDLFKNYEIIDIEGVGSFEAYTNRNALPYQELYGLKDAQTIFRGTLRNIGWCNTMKKASELGLFDDTLREDLSSLTCQELIMKLIGAQESSDLIADTAKFLGLEKHDTVIKKFIWLGLFDSLPLPKETNVMDIFCNLLQKKLVFKDNELDLIVLYHRFIAHYKNKRQLITSLLVDEGIPNGDSAMSRTVSLPAAIAAVMILQGKINLPGVHIPVQAAIYNPVLDQLTGTGLKFIEKTTDIK